MSDSVDLSGLLASWPFDPENDARFARGDDGRELLQVRTPLGIEQYELEGRPDGLRPHGRESALAFQMQRLAKARDAGQEDDFKLGAEECAELFHEGTLYYCRYFRLFQLKDWERTIRDTARNLKLFDFVHRHAEREEDQNHLERWRPYIVRMNAVAAAMLALDKGVHEEALNLVNGAVGQIEVLDEVDDETFLFERERSLNALRELAKQIQTKRPVSNLERLERQLRGAIESQAFERAAQLRDRIRELKNTQASK
jgi:hypothetical protein